MPIFSCLICYLITHLFIQQAFVKLRNVLNTILDSVLAFKVLAVWREKERGKPTVRLRREAHIMEGS